MNRRLCLLYLVCLAVMLVKSQSTVEIDENGDEYEVKRFHIQGRQLNENRSQCVVTRRKRATQPTPSYSNQSPDVRDDDNEDEEEQSMLSYSPPVIMPNDNEKDGEENEKQTEDSGKQEIKAETVNKMEESHTNKNNEEILKTESKQREKKEDKEDVDGDDDDDDDDDDDAIEVIQLNKLPILDNLESKAESLTALASAQDPAKIATGDIFVVQSQASAEFKPQTHAIFELIPVDHVGIEETNGGDTDNVKDDYYIKEELTPVTTTAIWSTGGDSLNGLYNDYDLKPMKDQKVVKTTRKPPKSNNKNKKSPLKVKRKNKYNNSYKGSIIRGNKKRRYNKNTPNKTGLRRRTKKRKPNRANNFHRRRTPLKNRKVVVGFPSKNQNKKNKSKKTLVDNKHHNFNNKNRVIAKKNKKKKNAEVIDQGEHTLTHTETMTQTGDEDNENVNCIIIHKDPPPTTARPFWNIFGRNANGAPQASGHFGKRKRANVRFLA